VILIAVRTLLFFSISLSWITANAELTLKVVDRNNTEINSASEVPIQGYAAYTYSPTKVPSTELQEQRETYQKILKSLRNQSRRTYKKLMPKLDNYPLKPYLEYVELATRLRKLPKKDVNNFLTKYDNTVYAARLKAKWMRELQRSHKGQLFIDYYDDNIANTSLTCYYHYAQYKTGQKNAALKGGIALWNTGKSQPKQCDPLFKILANENKITEELAWQRYMKALLNHQYQLARYLERFFTSPSYKNRYALFSGVHKDSIKLRYFSNFSAQDNDTKAIIADTLKHLAKRDATTALSYWNHYHQSHQFDVKTQSSINEKLVKYLFEQDHIKAADIYLQNSLQNVPATLIEWRLRKAILASDWADIRKWIKLLPEEYKQESRWQYWLARSDQILDNKDPKTIYQNLAKQRSYYGFLASDHLGSVYQMEDQPIKQNQAELINLAKQPSLQRATELFHIGENLAANREWYYATKNFSEQQWQTAAELAKRHQWDNRSILSMIKASYWNDMSLRFPLTYQQHMNKAGKKLGIETNLLLAIARQESALSPNAVSPAGARGLMQMMPATAKASSKKFGIKYKNSSDLFNVDKNIELCSKYYKQLLERFNNNRILASAGYNAGPHRATRWLKKSDGKLDLDMWVETIPFKETRGYVQNILAFSAIYQYRMGQTPQMLTPHEKAQKL